MLSHAFKSFFIETTEAVNRDIRPQIKAPLSEFHALFLPKLVYGWQSLCGAERLALHGYPLQAYSISRNIFDMLQLVSAAMQKFVDFYATEGLVPNRPFDIKKVRKLRKDTEFEASRVMSGPKSGLSQKTIEELDRWNSLFDYEVHGGRISLARSQDFMKGLGPLRVLPTFREEDFAIFVNRYCEVAWMAHRLLPLIQPSQCQFNDLWKQKWDVIDESFKTIVSSLTDDCNKLIGRAIVEYVDKKFPFDAHSTFPL